MYRNRKKLWITATLVLLVAVTAVCWLVHETRLDTTQRDALAQLERDEGQYDPQVIVLRDTTEAKASRLAKLYGARLRITENGRFATLTLPEGSTILDVYGRKESREYLEDMSADYYVSAGELEEEPAEMLPVRPRYEVSDPDYAMQGYLDYLNMEDAWTFYTGQNVTVAVIDSGIDTDHPEFAGRISEYSYNATEDKIVRDYDDWSLIEDEYGHGTAVTGVIAAAMDGNGIVGIAPNVEILVIKAKCVNGRFNTSDLVFGIYYAIERDVDIINMSFGGPSLNNPYAEALQLAYDSDIISVAAAGNSATAQLSYPAADPHVIGVGALEADGWDLAIYSNYGENTDVVAPGTTYTTQMGGTYDTSNGTSLASPVVAGVIALYMENNKYIPVDDLKENLYASCSDLGDAGRDWYYGFGVVDVYDLLFGQRETVHFDMLTDELENQDMLVIGGKPPKALPEPERLYAVFDGWYYDDTFTQEYQYYEDPLTESTTLYAKWVNEDDGIPFTYVTLEDGTVEIRSYTGHRRYITIPSVIDGKVVSSIGIKAFENQTRLREVTLPESLTVIREYAFEGCSNLVSIRIPENVTRIEAYAFAENLRLRTLAFAGSKLQEIGAFAFAYSGLDRVELPASVTSVDGSAFYGASSLYEIRVQSGNSAFTSKDGVLFSKSGDLLIAYPAAKGTAYTLPAGTAVIGDYAFAYSRLNGVDLTGISYIGNSAFSYSRLLTLTIPDSVVSMGSQTFLACEALAEVYIGAGLTELPEQAFKGCGSLTRIEIPDNILKIGSSAFLISGLSEISFGPESRLQIIDSSAFAKTNLRQIRIPATVIAIGGNAFAGTPVFSVTFAENSALAQLGGGAFADCLYLKEISLPNRLEEIGEQCFYGSGLRQITVPASVTQIGDGAFGMCLELERITVEAGNTAYHDRDGVLYNTDDTAILGYPSAKPETEYALPDTVLEIRPYAFSGTPHLVTVQLPQTLENIGSYAFAYSTGLQWLIIPDSVIQISRGAFEGSWNLSSINFGEASKISRLGYGAFANCGIYSIRIPANVSTMAQGVFEGCKNLNSVSFARGSKLESISAYLFDGAENLGSIYFEEGSALKQIQAHGLEGARKLYSIHFGDAKLEEVDNFAFRFCENLCELELPETLQSIGRYAFYGCKSLTRLTLPANLEHIGSYAFLKTGDMELYLEGETLPAYLEENWDHDLKGYYTGVSQVLENGEFRYAVLHSGNISILQYLGDASHVDLTTVDLGGRITAIGGSAFEGSRVKSVVLPETLTEIHAEAFRNSKLESITIPANVTFLGREAFAYTPLETVTFAAGSRLQVMEQYAFTGTKALKTVTLPAALTTMGTGVFAESGLQSVHFESGIGLTEIPQKAFADTKLESVALPDSITLVNHSAFQNVQTLKNVRFGENGGLRLMSNAFYHTGLTELHIPANVTYIGEYCFVALPQLQAFTVDENNPNYKSVDGLLLTKDGRKLVSVPAGRTGSLSVPLSVEEIGFGAFEESKLSEVKFHEDANILSLGYRAFFRAENITSITVPRSVVAIDYYAFAYCTSLKEVRFADGNLLKGIYEGAFCGDIALESILLPDSIVEISDWAFYGCTKLDTIPVSDAGTLKGIYDYAFAYTGLQGHLTTPESLIDIGSYAFAGNKLTSVTVPGTNQKDLIIGIGAFENCRELEEITLPFIGAGFEDEKITWFGYIFGAGSHHANATYVPESLKKITITDGITCVGPYAFHALNHMELALPDTVTGIEVWAFYESNITYELVNELTVYMDGVPHEYVHSQSVGTGISGHLQLAEGVIGVTLYECPGLTQITLPSTLENLHLTSSGVEELVLPDGLKSITCFFNEKLQSVVIPDSVTELPEQAFSNCLNLASVRLPANLTSIGRDAFSSCYKLTEIVIPEGVTSIGDYAFAYCNSLRRIQLPQTLTEIGAEAFVLAENLYEIINHSDLPLTVGSDAYGMVAAYAKVIIDRDGNRIYREGSEDYAILETPEGFCFEVENGVYTLIDYTGTEDTITLPTRINGQDYTIRRFHGGKHIIIPEGITDIGESAFYGNGTLETVTIADTVTSIGPNAFAECSALREIKLSDALQGITDRMFAGCVKLEQITLPDSILYIHSEPFANTAITSLYVPAGVSHIGSTTFSDNITDITIDPNNPYYVIVNDIIYASDISQIVYVPKSVTAIEIPASVTDIERAFMGHTTLRSVTFAEGSQLQVVGAFAFEGCTALEQVVLPDTVTEIQDFAFSQCVSLQQIDLPQSLLTLGFCALADCENLEGLILPEGLRSLGYGAIGGCHGLTEITIPASVTEIDPNAMRNCEHLEIIRLAEGNEAFVVYDGILYTKDLRQIVAVPKGLSGHIQIPEGITEILGQFNGSEKITGITLPGSVTRIDANAFQNCTGLQEMILPDSVTDLGTGVFEGCTNLRSVKLPAGLDWIPDQMFNLCTSLAAVNVPETVTSIGINAFANCESLAAITLPDTLKTIGNSAFYRCCNLTELRLPNSVEVISDGAFASCEGLTILEIPEGVKEIGRHAFASNSSLVQVTLPSTLTRIDEEAFGSCYRLYEIYNNSSLVLTIGSMEQGSVAHYANMIVDGSGRKTYREGWTDSGVTFTEDGFVFVYDGYSQRLTAYIGTQDTITLPDSFRGQEYWIENFRGGKHIIIPEAVTWITPYAFYGNRTLERVTLHDGITQIGYGAFANCTNLTEFTIPKSVTTLGGSILKDTPVYKALTWENGCLYKDGYLLEVDPETQFLTIPEGTLGVAEGAFDGCHKLVFLQAGVSSYRIMGELSNLQTLVITGGQWNLENLPLTLKNLVLTDSVTEVPSLMWVTDVTIYTEVMEYEKRWNDGWNWNNRVIYGGKWIWVNFYDQNGDLLYKAPQSCSAIVRPPYVELPEEPNTVYAFLGWDLDGDGQPDSLPATSVTDIHAYALVEKLHTHSYSSSVTAPTCTEQGYTTYTCTCGHSYVGDYTDPLGHLFTDYISDNNATCEEDGTKTAHCDRGCGQTDTVADPGSATGHTYGEEHITAPTCTEQGYTTYTCTCGHSYVGNYTDPLGHLFTDYISDNNATCEEDGTKTAHCDRGCGQTDTVADPGSATGHTYGEEHITAPTCTEQGYTTYTCTCGHSYVGDYTDPLGHDMGEWIIDKPATEEEEGLRHRQCSRCDHTEEEQFPFFTGPEEITSDSFHVGTETVSKIPVGTTVAQFLSGIGEGEYVKIMKDGAEVTPDALLGTGMEVCLVVDEQVIQTLTVVVTGDINGDGNITLTDMLTVKSHILKKSTLEGVYVQAADTNADDGISLTDYLQIKAHILKKSTVVPHSVREPESTPEVYFHTGVPVMTVENRTEIPHRPLLDVWKKEFLLTTKEK